LKEPYYSKVKNYYPKDYEKVKKKVLGIEEYKREKDHKYGNQPASEDMLHIYKPDIDINSLVTELAVLKINCLDQEGQLNDDLANKNIKFNNADIYMVEFIEASSENSDEYLMVEVINDNITHNLRPVGKRKRENGELGKYLYKKEKANEPSVVNG
ncbi:17349_t:CDS:2, partial [Racocetra persica]